MPVSLPGGQGRPVFRSRCRSVQARDSRPELAVLAAPVPPARAHALPQSLPACSPYSDTTAHLHFFGNASLDPAAWPSLGFNVSCNVTLAGTPKPSAAYQRAFLNLNLLPTLVRVQGNASLYIRWATEACRERLHSWEVCSGAAARATHRSHRVAAGLRKRCRPFGRMCSITHGWHHGPKGVCRPCAGATAR